MLQYIQRTTFKVSDFINWHKYGSLVLSPKFQRRSVWNEGAKSFLIDTILKGLPIPVLILRDIKTNLNSYESKKEVVDGQQRLRTIISYIAPDIITDERSFTVKAIHNKAVGGKLFSKIDDNLKQRILDYEFFVHVLPSNVSDSQILEIFSRMNSTGFKLNDQELRNAEYFGEFKTIVYNISLEFYDFWKKHGIHTDAKISRMAEVETMNDLFTIVIDGIIDRNPKVINSYYSKYDEVNSLKNKDEIVNRIKNVLGFINELDDLGLKKTIFTKSPLFYALFASVYDLQYGLKSVLTKKAPKKLNKEIFNVNLRELNKLLLENDKIPKNVFVSLTKGTNRLKARKSVFDYVNSRISNGL